MKKTASGIALDRRTFLRGAGGLLVAAAGSGLVPTFLRRGLLPTGFGEASALEPYDLFYGGTDGWISLPSSPPIGFYHPDNLAPAPFTTYVFGFRNLTGLTPAQAAAQKNHAQHSAPLFWLKEGADFKMQLTNLGLAQRPDLFDAHTIHWHGFRNVIPFFDGEPTGSVSVPAGRLFTYRYRPRDPGTYMFHCHVEDVEHVHMGMTGLVFVRPALNDKWAYNDAATAFDREFVMFLSEVWAQAHWADAHIQLPEWTDYRPDFALLNGRVYPDTLSPNAPFQGAPTADVSLNPAIDASGDLLPPVDPVTAAPLDHLRYQPYSSLVTCNAGEKVLLRFANLGFRESAMTLTGVRMRVVGKDATPMLGRGGADTSYLTSTVSMGAGESIDAIFTAPAFSGGTGTSGLGYDAYLLHNRAYARADHVSGGAGGQRTEVRVYPAGILGTQTLPNT